MCKPLGEGGLTINKVDSLNISADMLPLSENLVAPMCSNATPSLPVHSVGQIRTSQSVGGFEPRAYISKGNNFFTMIEESTSLVDSTS